MITPAETVKEYKLSRAFFFLRNVLKFICYINCNNWKRAFIKMDSNCSTRKHMLGTH